MCDATTAILRLADSLPRNWLDRVNSAQTKGELNALRRSIARGAPFGDERWTQRTANRPGLESSLRPRGRP